MNRIPQLFVTLSILLATAIPLDSREAPPPDLAQGSPPAQRSERADTLFLFPAAGPGSYGSPGTDERGFTFDGPDPELGEPAGWLSILPESAWWHVASVAICAGTGTDMSPALPFDAGDTENDFALWCGRLDPCGWATPPGYGNSWRQVAIVDLAGHSVQDELRIEFAYRSDFEGDAYDWFELRVETPSGWETVLRDETTGDRTYRELEVVVPAADLGGPGSETRVGFYFESDAAWSDQDGLIDSDVGAVWLDNLRLGVDGGEAFTADFEDGEIPAGLTFDFVPSSTGGHPELNRELPQDDDEIQNDSFCWTFIGQGDDNPDFPIPVIPYGPPYLDADLFGPICEVEPDGTPLEWREGDRLLVHFWLYGDVRNELIFTSYSVAARTAEGDCLRGYRGDNTVYHPYETGWELLTLDLTEHLLESASGGTISGVSFRLNVVDMCPFWCDILGDGSYHTPDPYFDNVRLMVLRDPTAAGETPAATALVGAWPNPFNPSTRVRFSLAAGATVSLRVRDVSGRLVRTLAEGPLPAGEHERIWDGRDDVGAPQASGVYLVDFRAGGRSERMKLVLLK